MQAVKSIVEYKEFIPSCWGEVLEKDNKVTIAILEQYGPLAVLIYSRIMNLTNEYEEMRELRSIAIFSQPSSNTGRDTGMEEIKFFQKILEFYKFNISFAKRDAKSRNKLKLLME